MVPSEIISLPLADLSPGWLMFIFSFPPVEVKAVRTVFCRKEAGEKEALPIKSVGSPSVT